MLALLSFLPIATLISLVVFFRKSVALSALISLLVLIGLALGVWQISLTMLVASATKGILFSTEIISIVFGSLLIFFILKNKGYLDALQSFLVSVSADSRVQVMLVGLGLVYFIEGVAGFGTPALLAVPLFLSLGFPAVLAVSLSLIGDSVPVIFGAIGLPVTFGIGSVMKTLGVDGPFIHEVTSTVALINIPTSVGLAIAMTTVLVLSIKGKKRDIVYFLPFAIFSGLAVSIPAYFTAIYVGAELPSVVGGLVGIFLIYLATKTGFLLPRKPLRIYKAEKATRVENKKVIMAFVPYLIVVAALLLSRLPFLPIKTLLQSIKLDMPEIFGQSVSHTFYPFYSASTIIVISALVAALVLRIEKKELKIAAGRAAQKIKRPFISLSAILVFVQIFIHSAGGASGMESMPLTLAQGVQATSGNMWPFFAPFVGALGAFVAGSATVSNLLFSSFQYNAAIATQTSPTLVLSLQGLGAAAGNMVSLHNVVAALAIAGIAGRESEVIKKNFQPLLYYLLVLGLLGLGVTMLG